MSLEFYLICGVAEEEVRALLVKRQQFQLAEEEVGDVLRAFLYLFLRSMFLAMITYVVWVVQVVSGRITARMGVPPR
jgi:hypothetical protein